MYEKKFTLKHVIKNFPDLDEEFSQKEDHFGVKWYIGMSKKLGHLAVYLRWCKNSDEKNECSIDFADKCCLIAEPKKVVVNGSPSVLQSTGWGMPKFYNWDDVINNDMIDNCVTVVCHVTIKKMSGIAPKRKICFEEPLERTTDMVVLKIGEQKFNVLKSLLAFRSPYFDTLFFKDFIESKKSEIELLDVDPNDFQGLLDAIYGEASVIQPENVEGVMKLADQFDVKMARAKCEKFLMKTDGVDKQTKLRLADLYNLEQLKSDCLKSITSVEDLKNCSPSDASVLKPSTLLALYEKSINFH